MTYVVYLKLTNRCNLRCEHCYNSQGVLCDMNQATLDKSIEFIRNKCDKLAQSDDLVVVFHGGEPMLCGVQIMNYVMDNLDSCQNISFTITTNLVYELTADKIDILKRISKYHGGRISTSYDYGIRFKGNQEQIWKDNVKTLLVNGISVTPIVSLTKHVVDNINPEIIFQTFIDLEITQMNFERITRTGRAEDGYLCPRNSDIDEWMLTAYDCSKRLGIQVNLFRSIEETTASKSLTGCRLRMCQKLVTTINPDGSLAGCPNTANSCVFGSVFGGIDKDKFSSSCCKEDTKNQMCLMCKYFRYCNGECFQLQWDETGCPGLRSVMGRILAEME